MYVVKKVNHQVLNIKFCLVSVHGYLLSLTFILLKNSQLSNSSVGREKARGFKIYERQHCMTFLSALASQCVGLTKHNYDSQYFV